MDLTGGLSQAIAALPAEAQPLVTMLMDRLDALEAQGARDSKAIADSVTAALVPQIAAMTATVNEVGGEMLTFLRRLDGASVKLTLAPEGESAGANSVKVEG